MRLHSTRVIATLVTACILTFLLGCEDAEMLRTPTPAEMIRARVGNQPWQIAHPAVLREIEGFASRPSVNRGETILLFVNTVEPAYTLEIFRLGWYNGAGAKQVLAPVTRPGTSQPDPVPDPVTGLVECNWADPFVVQIPRSPDPAEWPSGIYLAKLTASTSGTQSYITFVVRDDSRRSDLLFQASVTTYQAYNRWGGHSLYTKPRTYRVSFNRPYDRGYGSGEALFWEYSLLRFLEREGHDVTYTTDVDTHLHGELLAQHKAFLSVGHDEYWSWEMRDNVEGARERGVNLGFFGANTSYWQIRFETSPTTGEPYRTIVCYKNAERDPMSDDPNPLRRRLTTTQFRRDPVDRPENAMVGIMYESAVAQGDVVVSDSSSWVFKGTGVKNGDHLSGLLGLEADRLFDNAPSGTHRIAHSGYDANDKTQYGDMTVYEWPSGSTVVATGSMQWNWGLDESFVLHGRKFVNPAVQMATRNILRRFGALPAPGG